MLSSHLTSGDLFTHLEQAPLDPILGTAILFKADPHPDKVNLGIGVYKDDAGQSVVFETVRKVEKEILDSKLTKDYFPKEGDPTFRSCARTLLFGKDHSLVKDGKVASVQTLSGTGSLRLTFEFIKKFLPGTVYVSDPTWGNHFSILDAVGLPYRKYKYYLPQTRGLDFDGMVKDLEGAPAGSSVILHTCAHNPTGVDLNVEQWKALSKLFLAKKLVPVFDTAYQGFASGDLVKDVQSLHIFLADGHQVFVCQSMAKNFGLYGERIGALHITCSSPEVVKKVESQLGVLARRLYSNPPISGARIVNKIVSSPEYLESWKKELEGIVKGRMQECRVRLREELEKIGTPGTWNHITDQIGMFSYTGLTAKQCEYLTKEWHIYLLKSGRISIVTPFD